MPLRVVHRVPDRDENRLAVAGDGSFWSASDHALFHWVDGRPRPPLVSPDAVPGPLAVFGDATCWGPLAVLDGRLPASTEELLTEDGARLLVGLTDGVRVARVTRRPASRKIGGHSGSGPVLQFDGRRVDCPRPTAALWAGLPLIACGPQLYVGSDRLALPTRSEIRSLAAHPDGRVCAGFADGAVEWIDIASGTPDPVPVVADDAVTALASAGPRLAIGDATGRIRIAAVPAAAEVYDVGAPITALAWDGDRLLVLAAGELLVWSD